MSKMTIGAQLAGSILAMHEDGLSLLGAEMPSAKPEQVAPLAAMADAGVEIGRGERFVIHRGVAYVPVRGVLTANTDIYERWFGWSTYHGLGETMGAVSASEDVSAVVMFFDTPGGAVMGVQGAADAVRDCAKTKPVHALVHPWAASAGYWLASQCSDITLTPGAWVGSVGTMMTGRQPVQPGMSGDQTFVLTSRHAGAKRPDLSTEEGRAVSQKRLDVLEDEFHAVVAEGRGVTVDELRVQMSRSDNVLSGADIFWGDEAVERGLADGVETIPDFMSRVSQQYAPKPAAQNRSRAFGVRASAAQAAAIT